MQNMLEEGLPCEENIYKHEIGVYSRKRKQFSITGVECGEWREGGSVKEALRGKVTTVRGALFQIPVQIRDFSRLDSCTLQYGRCCVHMAV